MDAIITALRDALLAFGAWELNGLLAILYTAWEHGAALMAAGAFAALLFWTPPGRQSAYPVRDQLSGQRPGLLGIGVAVVLAACNGGGAATRPVIASFAATPASLPGGGGDVTLAWSVQGATGLSIEPGVGAASCTGGVPGPNRFRTQSSRGRTRK